ncbi:hypothetical protein RI129_008432 [Pyrocoelia pectoralis]|uniref:RRM domain-containing protein n=1 Tax=Pyrocoelia pectoralis TaxID=417401 RepID=A0AAN7V5D9_9COLE
MYRSDKQFMKNPATASSRIYIGNLMEQVTSGDLEERFKTYGTILGLVLQRGFGFIQYETDAQAQAAIKSEHTALFFGRKLNVRQAVDKSRLTAQSQPQNPFSNPHAPPPPKVQQQQQQQQDQRMESPPPAPSTQPGPAPLLQNPPKPLMENIIQPPKHDQSEKMDVQKEEPIDRRDKEEHVGQGRLSDVGSDNSDRKRPASVNRPVVMNRNRRERDHDRFGNDDFPMRDMPMRDLPPRELPPRDLPPRDLPPRDLPPRDLPPRDLPQRDLRDLPPRDLRDMREPYYAREDSFRGPAFIPPPLMDRPDRNDCEIIVVSRLLTEYAEYIEKRLKSIGLLVDLLYPNEDVPIGRVLANISSRGCLYAILVMPQNEEFHSLTLTVLHGIPQEHRNMPIDDAITLIGRNFEAYMRGDKCTNQGTGASLLSRHPENIQMILNLLAENRQTTLVQYDRIMKYLQDRRDLQRQFEATEGGGDNDGELQPHSKQAELQSRIMNILNNKSTDELPKPVEAPQPPPGSTPLLNDPTVQRALDSLLSGDMFKSIASGM